MEHQECKYGSSCYRRNSQHFIEFSHPFVEEIGQKIKDGLIEEILSLNLSPIVLEQAQVISELILSGDLVLTNKRKGVKRPRSPCNENKVDQSNISSGSLRELPTINLTDDSDDSDDSDMNKKTKLEEISILSEERNKFLNSKTPQPQAKISIAAKLEVAHPMRYFLSTVTSIPQTKDEPLSLCFADLLDPSLGRLKESVQFNFMVEFGWLLAQYCQHGVQRKPLLIVYGAETEEMLKAPKLVPTVQVARVKPKYPFGSHHTKMAIMRYEDDSLRIIVHTGNLIESDWEDRTQGLWVSPSCPKLNILSDKSSLAGNPPTNFKRDFLCYLESYSLPILDLWIEAIRNADMSAINVAFVSSIPGSHTSQYNSKAQPTWGHIQLGSLLKTHATRDEDSLLLVQCSSIGSLGPSPSSWLAGELTKSMSHASNISQGTQDAAVQVIYPSYENVKASIHGLSGGGCLPYSHQGHSKQLWFSAFLHHWKSENRLRTKAMPHIKSYTCVDRGLEKKAFWFVLTSANLSKAAWGMFTNKGNSLMIQSYEAGVLFLPKFVVEKDYFMIGEDLLLPFDLPLSKYSVKDEPWFIDHLRHL